MKITMAILLFLMSTSLLANNRPPCSTDPGACRGGIPSGHITGGNIAAIPEPSTLALIGLGVAGLVVARKHKR